MVEISFLNNEVFFLIFKYGIKALLRVKFSEGNLTKTAAMAISGSLENGLLFSGTDRNIITIYKDRINFGKSINPDLKGIIGNCGTDHNPFDNYNPHYQKYENGVERLINLINGFGRKRNSILKNMRKFLKAYKKNDILLMSRKFHTL